jgi:hypothetical protein
MPAALQDVSQWPGELQSLLMFVAPPVVWRAGLLVLGFPPTWVDTNEEQHAVEAATLEALRDDI